MLLKVMLWLLKNNVGIRIPDSPTIENRPRFSMVRIVPKFNHLNTGHQIVQFSEQHWFSATNIHKQYGVYFEYPASFIIQQIYIIKLY